MRQPTHTVAEVMREAARAVANAFPEEIWVEGEIRDLTRSQQGNVYFSLIDTASRSEGAGSAGPASSKPGTALPVALFAGDRVQVNRALVGAGAPRMTDGMHVRLKGSVSLYRARATVQLRMTWIDTEFTVGYLAAERNRILRTLAAADLLNRNRAIGLPSVPLRIGLVTSRSSAAEADFLAELESSGYAFAVTVFDTRVQGAAAVDSIVGSVTAANRTDIEIIALVRGGGSQSDLDAFDDEAVARAIATSSVPVFTGVGHEIDQTIADRVAHSNFKTPTACGIAIVDLVGLFDARLYRLADGIGSASRAHLERSDARVSNVALRVRAGSDGQLRRGRQRLETHRSRIGPLASASLVRAQARLFRQSSRLRHVGPRRVEEAERLLRSKQAVLAAHDPVTLLRRGWSLTRTDRGELVHTVDELEAGDAIVTTFSDGAATSHIAHVARDPIDTGPIDTGPIDTGPIDTRSESGGDHDQ